MPSKSFMIDTFISAGLKPWEKYIELLRRAYDQGAQGIEDFISTYDKMPQRERRLATPEEICTQSRTPQKIIFGVICGQLWELSYNHGDMILAINHPKIVAKAVKEALKPNGWRDREHLLKAGGVIPIPKTNSVHFHKHVSGGQAHVASSPAVLPSFEDDMAEVEEMPAMRQLPSGS